VDSYLILAEQVLREARRPLTAKQILSQAYLSAIVPAQLFGKTQHKTLGARLSEDILHRRERSAFFRTQPGQFFLRAFLNDAGVPARYRSEITARRRQRELLHGRALAISKSDVQFSPDSFEPPQSITDILSSHNYRYLRTMSRRPPDVFVLWSFVIVARHDQVLTYRHGRYREDRDSFFKRRSVGFFSPVVDRDRDLFALEDHGIVVNGLRAITMDLDLPRAGVSPDEYASRMKLARLIHGAPKNWLTDVA